MQVKTIEVEVLRAGGQFKEIIEIDVPANIPFEILTHEEFKNYTKGFTYNNSCPVEKMIYTQQYSEHCNGYPKYYLSRFEKLIVCDTDKQYRLLDIGEAWALGAKID